MNLFHWGAKWGIPVAAIEDMRNQMGLGVLISEDITAQTEAGAQKRIRMRANMRGEILWRNNVGACMDERGNYIRYGLCNESKELNERVKSSDLIGIKRVVVTPDMVGREVGIFLAVEVKAPGWVYSGSKREEAQRAFGNIVTSHGGEFRFEV